MSKEVIPSGVKHSVSTSDFTKDAINPRNKFVETEKPSLHDASQDFAQTPNAGLSEARMPAPEPAPRIEAAEPNHCNHTTHIDTTHRAVLPSEPPKASNRQLLPPERPTDQQKFFESLQRIEDRLQKLRAKKVAPNIQRIDTDENLRDRKLYKEKKNLHNHMASAQSAAPHRADPLLTPAQTAQAAAPAPTEDAQVFEDMNLEEINGFLDGAMNQFNENELRERVRKMKARLVEVKHTLSDVEAKKNPTMLP